MLPQPRICVNLRRLTINSLNASDLPLLQECNLDSLIVNRGSLDSLTIGFEEEALLRYGTYFMWTFMNDGGELSAASRCILEYIARAMQRRAHEVTKMLSPESLRLTSFDAKLFLEPAVSSFLNLSRLTTLALESCAGDIEALDLLSTRPDQYQFRPSQLRSLTFRAEFSSLEMVAALEGFICSLSELTDLCVLFEHIEGDNPSFSPKRILEAIGKTLKTLVIDARYGPRNYSDECTSSTSWDDTFLKSLRAICGSCSNLIELGLALDWKFLSSSELTAYQV